SSIRLDPGLVEAYNNLGVIAFREGAYKAAEGYFTRSVELKEDGIRLYNLALTQRRIGKNEEARRNMEKAYSILPLEKIRIELGSLNEERE
ncbi:MAG TPA: tetratricopeptide repeat protein, partial [bacterium]|nr:tetratricopeptide repeat protein [bacterium]